MAAKYRRNLHSIAGRIEALAPSIKLLGPIRNSSFRNFCIELGDFTRAVEAI
ncbi:MAG: hypothetical protein CFH10_01096 [Alphaproteobacteria bacterium MarineAlpha4_Bin2]|nr:MAG: hypothetical protein CFH10_01096 [Alphaproteobacteria bacterium MarineAlpha4_Bin2]